MTDLTREVLKMINSNERIDPELVEEVYEFYNAVDETSGKGSWRYQPRAKKGSRDGHKTERRVVWKRDYFGKLYRGFE